MRGYYPIRMTMGFIGDDGIDSGLISAGRSSPTFYSDTVARGRTINFPIIESKILVPAVDGAPVQKRLIETVKRSIRNHSGTMLVGRAGSGKTFLAANIAADVKGSAWYSLDAGDADWKVFQRYFRAVILGKKEPKRNVEDVPVSARKPLELITDVSSALERLSAKWPRLIVLDSVHHLFDSDWFKDAFDHVIRSLPSPSHILLTSRSKPPNFLWRMRSKQVLNVYDEKLLEISVKESEELFSKNGLSRAEGRTAHRESFGRTGKLMSILESKRPAHL
jgi:ATP/maltotriose-dependent transcriptional regulator MalT